MYVDLTYVVSKGGLPNNRAKQMTPVDQTSTSYEWPVIPSTIYGAM